MGKRFVEHKQKKQKNLRKCRNIGNCCPCRDMCLALSCLGDSGEKGDQIPGHSRLPMTNKGLLECLLGPWYRHTVVRKLVAEFSCTCPIARCVMFWPVVVEQRNCENMPHILTNTEQNLCSCCAQFARQNVSLCGPLLPKVQSGSQRGTVEAKGGASFQSQMLTDCSVPPHSLTRYWEAHT